jgi:hypothetical protein
MSEDAIERIRERVDAVYRDVAIAMRDGPQSGLALIDAILRKNGHFAGGEALESARKAATLRWKSGKVSVTDGPYAETKEQLGGILILEARDLNHAIQLMSQHRGVKAGPFKIRPAADLSALVAESERRRTKTKGGSK